MLRFLCLLVAILLPGGACLSQAAPSADAQDDFAAHLQKAKQHLDEKRPDLAIPELEAAATIHPNSVETRANLGVLLYFKNRIAEAIPHLRLAVENQPGLSKLQGLLGLAEVHVGEIVVGRLSSILFQIA